jgi:hypothetical protein
MTQAQILELLWKALPSEDYMKKQRSLDLFLQIANHMASIVDEGVFDLNILLYDLSRIKITKFHEIEYTRSLNANLEVL